MVHTPEETPYTHAMVVPGTLGVGVLRGLEPQGKEVYLNKQ